jgi:hypothetical protein
MYSYIYFSMYIGVPIISSWFEWIEPLNVFGRHPYALSNCKNGTHVYIYIYILHTYICICLHISIHISIYAQVDKYTYMYIHIYM